MRVPGLRRLYRRFRKLPSWMTLLFAFILVLVLFQWQVHHPSTHSLYVLYLVPVFIVAWYVGRWSGFLIAILAGLSALVGRWTAGENPGWEWLVFDFCMFTVFYLIIVHVVSTLHNVLRRERLHARRDPLTGLLNIRGFYESAPRELKRCRRHGHTFSTILFDIDDFKVINDTRGHPEGDELLRTIAEILKSELRETDTVARIGGDEFIVLLYPSTPESARMVAQRVVDRVHQAFQRHGWPAGLSAGVVTFSKCPDDIRTMIVMADETMYVAKMQGKHQIASKVYGVSPLLKS